MKSYINIMAWSRETGLRPYLSALNADKQHAFGKDILCALSKVYPVSQMEKLFLDFPGYF